MKIQSLWHRPLTLLRNLYDWMGKQAHSTHDGRILAVFFFIEAIVFFPADPLLILFCAEKRRKVFYYATIATVASVVGGVAAYFIGLFVWNSVGQKLVSLVSTPESFAILCEKYKANETWAILITGITPLPYKLITLTAGFCKLPLIPFIICSFIARGVRFYLIATLMYIWGIKIKEYIDRYFFLLVLLFILLVVGTFLIVSYI